MNPYEILHLKPGASEAAIQQAYRDLVRVWHPDRFAADARLQKIAEEKLSQINQAYTALEKMGRISAMPIPETAARPAVPAQPPSPRRSFLLLWSAIVAAVLVVAGIRVWAFLEAPMNALAFITADARRVASWSGPSLTDAFRGWNGVLPQGLDRLLDSYRNPTVPRSVEVSRPPARAVAPRARTASNSAFGPRLRQGNGEIRVHNRTGEDIRIVLTTTRAQAAAFRSLHLPPQGEITLDGLGPDLYLLDVSFPNVRRQAMRLGPFVMVQIETAREIQADEYDVTLKPSYQIP